MNTNDKPLRPVGRPRKPLDSLTPGSRRVQRCRDRARDRRILDLLASYAILPIIRPIAKDSASPMNDIADKSAE